MQNFKRLSVFMLSGFLATSLIVACSPAGNNSSDPSVRNAEHELIGRIGKITYPGFQAEVHYINDSTIHWKTVDTKGAVSEETEHIAYKKLDDHLFFLNWMEESGLTVSQVINTKDQEVTAYLTYKDATVSAGRKTEYLHGKFEYISNH